MHDRFPAGLTHAAAARQLAQDGHNELPAAKRRTGFVIVREVAREPMFMLLLVAGAIYLLLGDLGDALMLLGFVFVSMLITIFQQRRTERVLDALRDLSSPRALVLRNAEQLRIPGRDVVQGDLLILEEGDRVAADATLIESHDLLLDESLLTGESVAVAKSPDASADSADAPATSGARVYSGSMVLQGGGLARVTATGANTEIGKIGRAMQAITPEPSPLQQEIGMLVRRFAAIGILVSLAVLLLYGWQRADWLNGLLAGISLAMSLLPEEFTVILTVFMALGAWRISKNHVLTRHTPVIEALGSATVLCVDKTGTLTQNRMTLKTAVLGLHTVDLDCASAQACTPEVRELLQYAVLASEITPFDPMEKAFHRSLDTLFPHDRDGRSHWPLVHEYPLTRELMAMTHVWHAGSDAHVVAVKGAPEAIARLCKLDALQTEAMLQQVQAQAAQGMRVLAVAKSAHAGKEWPAEANGFDFTWLGLVGLADPLRPAVPMAVRDCHQAGIRVVMITGDYPVTAQAIAREAGLPFAKVVTGAQLDGLDDASLHALVREVHVFARILPEQKLRLVQAFKANGEVVAMTGDGVNDAPALKQADIGISMGERGTDVAREASSLVLLDDDFTSIVQAIRLGRRIYDNVRKAMIYVVAVHVPIAGMVLLPLLFATPVVFAPIHIVFLEMIINPACAIVFEAEREEADSMRRPPRATTERLFGAHNVMLALLQGLGLLVAVAAVFFLGLRSGLSDAEARAIAFTCVVLGNLLLIIASRSSRHSVLALLRIPNQAQWWVLAGSIAALAAVLYAPPLQGRFHFAPVHADDLVLPLAAVFAALAWFELMKYAFNGGRNPRSSD
jgi:Ca2+-transporting ATPase